MELSKRNKLDEEILDCIYSEINDELKSAKTQYNEEMEEYFEQNNEYLQEQIIEIENSIIDESE